MLTVLLLLLAPAPRAGLVDITTVNPRIRLDIRYATANNFTRQKVYDEARCLLRDSTARKLNAVQRELEGMGLGLKVFDCYRPLPVQKKFWAIVPDERYVADPAKGSRHNRGAARTRDEEARLCSDAHRMVAFRRRGLAGIPHRVGGAGRFDATHLTQRFLMCAPRFYDVGYVINPWMESNIHRVDRTRAQRQWLALRDCIESRADVHLIAAEPKLPDMVFTANAGLVLGDEAILSSFRYAERKGEEEHYARWFSDNGFCVRTLPPEIPFEGAGDALLDRERGCVWMGFGYRTAREASAHLQKYLRIEVVPLELVDPRFYHLDTCFCPLSRGYVMYYPDAFSESSRATLTQRIPPGKRIVAGEEDARRFACNAVCIGDVVLLNDASQSLTDSLTRAGFQVQTCALSEFLRAGGASKCLTLRMEDPL